MTTSKKLNFGQTKRQSYRGLSKFDKPITFMSRGFADPAGRRWHDAAVSESIIISRSAQIFAKAIVFKGTYDKPV